MIASGYFVFLADGDEGWIKLVVPVVIGIFYILSAIAKSKTGKEEDAGSKQGAPGGQKPRQPQHGRAVQRPVPGRYTERPGPAATGSQRPKEVPARVARPLPVYRPAGVATIEQKLKEKLQRLEASGLQGATPIKETIAPAIVPKAPPVDVKQAGPAVLPARRSLELRLHEPGTLREAVILREILDKPLALR